MKHRSKQFLSILLGLALLLGLMMGMSTTAYADVPQEGSNSYVGYRRGTNGFDVYGIREKADGTTEKIRTTYYDNGYTTVMKVGESGSITFDSFAYGKEYISNDVKASITASVHEKSVLVDYALFNNSNETKTVKIGSYCDAKIGDDDRAPCSFTGNGIRMTSIDGNTEFLLIPGGGNFTTRWYGYYGDADDNVFNNQTDTGTYTGDSGIAWSWEIEIPAGATVTKTAELSAGQARTKQIIYNANGGTGNMDPTVDIPGESIKLNKNTFTKDDCVFQGWDTNSAGTTVVYADEATLTMPDTDTTLYAVWKENPEITAAAEGFEGAYDGKEHGITVTVTDPSSGATIKYGKTARTYDLDASPTITNVVDSPLTVYFKVTADGYKDYTGSATVTINKANAVPATVTANNRTYDGAEKSLVTVDNSTLDGGMMQYALGSDATTEPTEGWNADIPAATNAGTYYVWYKAKGDDNHVDSDPAGPVTVTIAKADPALTKPEAIEGLVYNGGVQDLTTPGTTQDGSILFALGENGTTEPAADQFVDRILTESAAKVYYVWFMVKGDENHNDSKPASVTAEIAKKDVTVSGITAADKPYDGNTTATLDTSKAVFTGKLDADTLTVTATGTFADADVGENKKVTISGLTLSGDGAANYQLAAEGQQTETTASIKANELKITAEDYTGVYDGKAHSISVTTEVEGVTITFAESEGGTYSATNPAYTNAGVYTVYYKAEKTGYTTVTGAKTVTISRKEVTVTAADQEVGLNGTIDTSVSKATLTGALEGHTLSAVTLTASSTAAATTSGTITPSAAKILNGETDVTANYNITYANGKLTVNKGAAAVTTAPAAIPDLKENGSAQALVTAGAAEGGTMQYALGTDATTAPTTGYASTIPAGTDAGTYYVWYMVAGDANHTDTAPVCVTVTIAADDPEPEPTYNDLLLPVLTSDGKRALQLDWKQMSDVEGYDIWLATCGSAPLELLTSVPVETTSYTISGLQKGTGYKVKIQAYVTKDGVKRNVGRAFRVHCITSGGNETYTNPKKLTLKTKSFTLADGSKATIEATVTGFDKDKELKEHDGILTYFSLNPSVATVTDKGVVKGKSIGTTTIYVLASNGMYKTVKVTVVPKATSIAFEKKSYTVKAGKKLDLSEKLIFTPEGSTASLKWESSDESIAKVSSNGKVTALKRGTVTIKVTGSGGLKAIVKIKVK